jgi:hypothetical protein
MDRMEDVTSEMFLRSAAALQFFDLRERNIVHDDSFIVGKATDEACNDSEL